MNENLIPISTLFIGINGFIAFVLSYIVAMERTKTRVWHGESNIDVKEQPDYLEKPNAWAAFFENLTQKLVETKAKDDGVLQRKVRAHSNFTEYVPLALLLIITLELMNAASFLIWLLGSCLTIARIAHAWGLIKTYGPSPGRAFGFFLTWFVYLIGSGACIFYGVKGLI
ncbi:MAPEG family protein [Calothrix sp. CCY 0018]|uniref:MAPEG family protein n=1 Tax=Calothrix sp. CCY 0018 TaxID=3103864 RepID=UPI0039C6BE2C